MYVPLGGVPRQVVELWRIVSQTHILLLRKTNGETNGETNGRHGVRGQGDGREILNVPGEPATPGGCAFIPYGKNKLNTGTEPLRVGGGLNGTADNVKKPDNILLFVPFARRTVEAVSCGGLCHKYISCVPADRSTPEPWAWLFFSRSGNRKHNTQTALV